MSDPVAFISVPEETRKRPEQRRGGHGQAEGTGRMVQKGIEHPGFLPDHHPVYRGKERKTIGPGGDRNTGTV